MLYIIYLHHPTQRSDRQHGAHSANTALIPSLSLSYIIYNIYNQHGAHSANTALILPTRRSVGRNGAFLACFWLATARYPLPGRGAAPCAIAANRGARRPCAGARIPCSPPIPTRSQAHRLAVGELEPPICAQAGRRVCGQCGKTAQNAGRACRLVSGHATRASQHAGSCRQMQRAEGGVGAGGQSPPLHTNNSPSMKFWR